ncbi:MAG: ATP synthase F0 subunit B [Acidobacteria bacterium]|nr:ATP synthase F0 subunit B [Acidobacteriota bacterium]
MIVLALAGNVLSIDGSFLFILISIIILIYVLNRTLFKPLNRVLDERERLGAGRLAEAKRLLKEHEDRLKSYEGQLRAAKVETFEQQENYRRQAHSDSQKMIAQIKDENAAQIAAAQEEIAKQAAIARQSLEKEARAMASTISSQILHRGVGSGGD